MVVTFGYKQRKSLVETFDPRARWIFSLLSLFTIVNFWDIRFQLYFLLVSVIQYALTHLTWKETKRAWRFILFLMFIMVFVNTIVTSAGTISEVSANPHVLFTVDKPIHFSMSIERLWFALTQVVRVLAITMLFIVVPFTMDPRQYGITFKGMGLGDKLAFTMDLAFRFVPTLARDFGTTMDAQKARGYEMDSLKGNIFKKIARMAPIMIPVTMNSLLSGEDMINAMDMRGFSSTGKRTWLYVLKYRKRDIALIAYSVIVLIVSIILPRVFDIGGFWVPAFLIP